MEERLLEKEDEFYFRLVEFERKVECLSRNIPERCEDMGPHLDSEVRARHIDLGPLSIE